MINKKIKKKKLIKVIDSPYSSFILEKIFENYNDYKQIIEIKKDLRETRSRAINILKLSQKKLFQKNKFVLTSSMAFSLSSFKIMNVLNFRKLQKNIFKKICFEKDQIYIGSRTSTIMNVLPKSNRILIDHGFSDYNRKVIKISLSKKIIANIKEKISDLIGYPYISLNEELRGYTVCKIPKFSSNFVDIQYLPTNKVLKNSLIQIKKKFPKINTIFLLTKNWQINYHKGSHSEVDYDKINLELIKKYAVKGKKFFIKFHEFTIQSKQSDTYFIKKAHRLGYLAVDVDRHLKECYRGMIPAELLISNLKLKRVVSKYSSTLHNICHNTSLDCIMDINPELRLINNHPKYYKSQLLKKFRERYNFNKLTRGRVNIKQIKKENF
tara:strand:+ start:1617 stop:2762 length:1146 start_codon:yes stop_codon:yes gene_type:complete